MPIQGEAPRKTFVSVPDTATIAQAVRFVLARGTVWRVCSTQRGRACRVETQRQTAARSTLRAQSLAGAGRQWRMGVQPMQTAHRKGLTHGTRH